MLYRAIAGVDLAGKENNPTGVCILEDEKIVTAHTDEEILSLTSECDLFAIDAPLMLCVNGVRIREADRILKRYGAMPPTILMELSTRGTGLAKKLLQKKKEVIEVFPTATAKILGVWDRDYKKTAEKLGLKVRNKHELDAYLCALTGRLWIEGGAIAVGDEEGKVVVPKGSPPSEQRP